MQKLKNTFNQIHCNDKIVIAMQCSNALRDKLDIMMSCLCYASLFVAWILSNYYIAIIGLATYFIWVYYTISRNNVFVIYQGWGGTTTNNARTFVNNAKKIVITEFERMYKEEKK
jgi:hypothetical protein